MFRKSILALAGVGAGLYMQKKSTPQCCGIIGVVSQKRENIGDLLSQGIELLKNRGYDSAGIVAMENCLNSKPVMVKHADSEESPLNCIEQVVEDVTKNIIRSQVGIGHTRWATCG